MNEVTSVLLDLEIKGYKINKERMIDQTLPATLPIRDSASLLVPVVVGFETALVLEEVVVGETLVGLAAVVVLAALSSTAFEEREFLATAT